MFSLALWERAGVRGKKVQPRGFHCLGTCMLFRFVKFPKGSELNDFFGSITRPRLKSKWSLCNLREVYGRS